MTRVNDAFKMHRSRLPCGKSCNAFNFLFSSIFSFIFHLGIGFISYLVFLGVLVDPGGGYQDRPCLPLPLAFLEKTTTGCSQMQPKNRPFQTCIHYIFPPLSPVFPICPDPPIMPGTPRAPGKPCGPCGPADPGGPGGPGGPITPAPPSTALLALTATAASLSVSEETASLFLIKLPLIMGSDCSGDKSSFVKWNNIISLRNIKGEH